MPKPINAPGARTQNIGRQARNANDVTKRKTAAPKPKTTGSGGRKK